MLHGEENLLSRLLWMLWHFDFMTFDRANLLVGKGVFNQESINW